MLVLDKEHATAGAGKPQVSIPIAGTLIKNEQHQGLFLLRKGSHGAGKWCLPAGHQRPDETPAEAAAREVKEETGIDIDIRNLRLLGTYPMRGDDDRDYLFYVFVAHVEGVAPRNSEPDKCEKLEWFPIELERGALPQPLYGPIKQMVQDFLDN